MCTHWEETIDEGWAAPYALRMSEATSGKQLRRRHRKRAAPPRGYLCAHITDPIPALSSPKLEELGINVEHILLRMQGVAFFKKLDEAHGCLSAEAESTLGTYLGKQQTSKRQRVILDGQSIIGRLTTECPANVRKFSRMLT